ncbi:Holliday junction branch migration protein RuvA [Candidatus Cardinium hertigii]|jgi:Holliday junction DNA helicase RuvA|uniref:Holliday junction branch migration complex subunit RuvA n=1 Tax=Candidatus Cardinium hertigii TaxID=247481 RepID=A0A3N2QAS4_9BACT|nr:Holliday junction branch migration protein RuvA [Candidatus Cardinium hertigii]ROT46883.1 Holliday junction branch migration protein RuvA [Candidatus Cardinium hertigii]
MIAQLIGKLLHKEPTYVILDVGGVGYELYISLYTFAQIKALERCTLLSAMHVKSEVFTLYGFYTLAEKAWWLRLISVSSIGPKTALTILSSLAPEELHYAILDKNERLLTSIKGIGAKAAQRLILELTDQAQKLRYVVTPNTIAQNAVNSMEQDAIMALTTLGLTQKVAEKAIAAVRAQAIMPLTLEELIKKALNPFRDIDNHI